MPVAPRAESIPKIPGALKFYKVMAYITGTFLLLLVAEMILKYMIDSSTNTFVLPSGMTDPNTGDFVFLEPGYEIEAFGPQGFLALVPNDTVTAVNLSIGILIVHGWLYVLYLFAGFRLWSMMRWPASKLLIIALGGIIPVLSFVVESIYAKQVVAFLAQQKTPTAPVKGEAA
jgi:integral membrane protein